MPLPDPNQLIVEGVDDLHAVVGLMRNHMVWTDAPRPVEIKIGKSASEILEAAYLPTAFKQSGLVALGVILDADDVFESRWAGVKRFCEQFFEDVPAILPVEGLVLENSDGKRCGVWIMPDNSSAGMLETFCSNCSPPRAP